MALDYNKLLNWPFVELEQSYTSKDTMLYALGVGLGHDPLDQAGLPFVYEDELRALPTMAAVLAYPGFWIKEQNTGIDWVKVLHAGQDLVIHKPLPATATVVATTRVTEILDKGPLKGALLLSERTIRDKHSGEAFCTVTQSTLARGDGGFSRGKAMNTAPASASKLLQQHPNPSREPELLCDLQTLPQAALIYRLNGDYNPLHASPKVARDAGFKAPILQGLCTFGVAGHALLKTCCDYDPARLKRIGVRFSAPVYPGETIRTEIWRDGNDILFRCLALERNLVVINNGYAQIS